MWGTHDLGLFLVTCWALSLIPGPSTMYILGRSVSQGRKAGIVSVLGISFGTICHTFAVAFGLSALLAASQPAFAVIKFAGAAYLIFLGIQTLRKKSTSNAQQETNVEQTSARRVFGQGLVTQMLNPKVSLFFLALLPQFVMPTAVRSPLPFLLLGLILVTIDTLWFVSLVCASAMVTQWLRRSAHFQKVTQWATGLIYIGLGLNLLRAKLRTAS